MNSRERIIASINHQKPDKVPVDMGATTSSGISAIAYSNLLKHISREDLPVLIYDVVQQLAQPDDFVLERFGVDSVDIGRTYNDGPTDWYPVTMTNGATAYYPLWFKSEKQADGSFLTFDSDGSCVISKMPAGGTFFDQCYFPYSNGYPSDFSRLDDEMNMVMWARYPRSPWDHASEPDFYTRLREKALRLRQNTDKALVLGCGCNLFEWGTFLRRMDHFLMDLICEEDKVEALLDQLLERHLKKLEKVCSALGDVVDIIKFGDDFGMTTGPFMSTEKYRQLFKPRLRQLCDYVKKHSKMHILLHSCGSIYAFMPDMIDAGIEIFNPVQTNCVGMDFRRLKQEFGSSCTFWGGGIETAGTLNVGSPEQVREQVLERMEVLSKGGGFVFSTIHNILPDVPPQNIVAMFDAVNEFNSEWNKEIRISNNV
jgi:uroporphyrinogen decarboxylase